MKEYAFLMFFVILSAVCLYQESGRIVSEKESCSRFVQKIVQEKITFYNYESALIIKEYLILRNGNILSTPIGFGEMNFGCKPVAIPVPPIFEASK